MSLGSPRVGTIHVQAPTPHAPALQAFLADFSQQTTRFSHLLAMVCFQSSPRALGCCIDGVCGTVAYPSTTWKIYEEIVPKAQRIFGDEHPTTISFKAGLENVAVSTSNYIRHVEQTQVAARKIILRFLRRCGGGAP